MRMRRSRLKRDPHSTARTIHTAFDNTRLTTLLVRPPLVSARSLWGIVGTVD